MRPSPTASVVTVLGTSYTTVQLTSEELKCACYPGITTSTISSMNHERCLALLFIEEYTRNTQAATDD